MLLFGPKVVNWWHKFDVSDLINLGIMHLKISSFTAVSMANFLYNINANISDLSEKLFTNNISTTESMHNLS